MTAPSPVDPDEVAALVLACPSVVRLSGGPDGGAGTYLPGRRLRGVRVSDDGLAVHLVVRHGPTAQEVAQEVRAALAAVAAGRPVDVVLEEVLLDDELPPTTGPAALARSPLAVQEP